VKPPAAHRTTSAHLQAAYPFVAEGGLPCSGVYIGRDLFGSSFVFDAWELYERRVLTCLNVLVLGMIGRGKSALVKSLLARSILHGVHGVAFDVKGEYGALARSLGCEPLRLAPGGSLRLNPLDPRSSERDQAELVEALAATALNRSLRPEERSALELALAHARRRAGEATLPHVVEILLDPAPEMAAAIRTTPAALALSARELALELRRLCDGALAGMFDGPTSTGVDFAAPLVVVDLSAVYHSPALPVVMTCVAAWLQAALAKDDGRRRIVVMDESWRMFSHLAIASWMQQSFKLARSTGTMNVMVMHRLSDLGSAGAAGSHQVRLAEGLLADTETRVVYGQPPSEVDKARELLGLSDTEARLLPNLPRGQALWKVGTRSFLVEHRLSAAEAGLVDTDARMVARGGQAPLASSPQRDLVGGAGGSGPAEPALCDAAGGGRSRQHPDLLSPATTVSTEYP
jgi:type IV secretory pathway VirB4 component